MPRGEYLGGFERMALLAVARIGVGAYGIAILREVRDWTRTEAAVASVYAALDRARSRGLVSSTAPPGPSSVPAPHSPALWDGC
jgi:DNA-binding PadR family transcriptional regulator